MTSLRKLKSMQIAEQGTKLARTRHGLSTMSQLLSEVDNKQPMSIAATVHWKLLFCIVLYLDDAFGWLFVAIKVLYLILMMAKIQENFCIGEDTGHKA